MKLLDKPISSIKDFPSTKDSSESELIRPVYRNWFDELDQTWRLFHDPDIHEDNDC